MWIEAVSGYYSASKIWAENNNKDDSVFWSKDTKSYYIHGKDNIPFHSIIWPSILLGIGESGLPTQIISNEYVTIEKKKLSTSKNWAVWIPEILETYHPDSIRYFLTINAPENRDSDFSWREFVYSHNAELLGAYGNLINRTLKFIEKSFGGNVPDGEVDHKIKDDVQKLYPQIGSLIEAGHFKQALESLFEFIRGANKYFDTQKPWVQVNESADACADTLITCIYIIANIAQLLSPFLPFSSDEIKKLLQLPALKWEPLDKLTSTIANVHPLFERLDLSMIDIEIKKLKQQSSLLN